MKIVFEPHTNDTNMYVSILVDELRNSGFEIYSLQQYLSDASLRREIRIVHLNWYENISGRGFIRIYLKYVKHVIKLRMMKLSGSKVIWTMHNQQPHDSSYLRLKKSLLKIVIEKADAIVVHSRISFGILKECYNIQEKKVFYLAHPNYIGLYGTPPVPNTEIPPLKVLFLGAVKRYKNIEVLLDVAKHFKKSQIVLTIAGKPESDAYAKNIIALASDVHNVSLHLEFVRDEDVSRFLLESDIVVTPYENKSILNSGSIYLALSYGKTVISPTIGTTIDILNKQGGEKLIFSYDYRDEKEHKDKLVQILNELMLYTERDPNFFKNREQAARSYMNSYHDNKKIAAELSKIYFAALEP